MLRYFLVTFVLIFSGCKLNIYADIFVGDILEALDKKGSEITTPGDLQVEVPSCESEDNFAEITNLLKSYFLDVKTKTCQSKGMDSLLNIGINIPILANEDWEPKTPSTLAITGERSREGDLNVVTVFLKLNKSKFFTLNKAVENSFQEGLSFEESVIKLNVHNDGRNSVSIRTHDSFIDSVPKVFSLAILTRRKKIEIEPSNVKRLVFESSGSLAAFSFLG